MIIDPELLNIIVTNCPNIFIAKKIINISQCVNQMFMTRFRNDSVFLVSKIMLCHRLPSTLLDIYQKIINKLLEKIFYFKSDAKILIDLNTSMLCINNIKVLVIEQNYRNIELCKFYLNYYVLYNFTTKNNILSKYTKNYRECSECHECLTKCVNSVSQCIKIYTEGIHTFNEVRRFIIIIKIQNLKTHFILNPLSPYHLEVKNISRARYKSWKLTNHVNYPFSIQNEISYFMYKFCQLEIEILVRNNKLYIKFSIPDHIDYDFMELDSVMLLD